MNPYPAHVVVTVIAPMHPRFGERCQPLLYVDGYTTPRGTIVAHGLTRVTPADIARELGEWILVAEPRFSEHQDVLAV
jgi:hypothetical protein